jgi:hypothetical protein
LKIEAEIKRLFAFDEVQDTSNTETRFSRVLVQSHMENRKIKEGLSFLQIMSTLQEILEIVT